MTKSRPSSQCARTMELFPAAKQSESRCGLEDPRHPQSLDCIALSSQVEGARNPTTFPGMKRKEKATREECRGTEGIWRGPGQLKRRG